MTATASLHPTPVSQGHTRLWNVFWLQGVIPSNILWAIALWGLANQRTTLVLAMFAVLLLYTGWIIPAVWRAAPTARTANLGVAARGLTVAWGLNTVLVIFFLTMQLVVQ